MLKFVAATAKYKLLRKEVTLSQPRDLVAKLKEEFNQEEFHEDLAFAVAHNITVDNKNIFSMNQNLLAKRVKSKHDGLRELQYASFLYDNEISVPEFNGFVGLDKKNNLIDYNSESKKWFLVMQRINGVLSTSTRGEMREEALRQYKIEVEKILNLGICPVDSDWHKNSIFSPEEEKLYLIDFESYRVGKPWELGRYYDVVMSKDFNFRTRPIRPNGLFFV